MRKKIQSALAVSILLIAGAQMAARQPVYESETEKTQEVTEESAGAAKTYEEAESDLLFWYADASYDSFFRRAAEDYYAQTGRKVSVEYKTTTDYIGEIYDETIQDGTFPDVYLLSGENLEEAYLYGLVSVNQYPKEYEEKAAGTALLAASYEERLLGYPLSYNVCVFVYREDYFDKEPESIQQIIAYSKENEPPENVKYLMEWEVSDPFYDFPFVANSVSFDKEERESMKVSYDETLYQEDLAFFEEMLGAFSLDYEQVTGESVIVDFKEGETLCAIVGSDYLSGLSGETFGVMEVPALKENLPSKTCENTRLVVVNDFSQKGDMAAEFARFLTIEEANLLREESGHYSVILKEDADEVEKTAYAAYETAVLAPDSMDAKDFWMTLKENIRKYF